MSWIDSLTQGVWPGLSQSVRTGDVCRQGRDIREGNSRTGTIARDAGNLLSSARSMAILPEVLF